MIKQILSLIGFLLTFCLQAQEGISTLRYNSSLFNKDKGGVIEKKSASFDDIYIYKYDTISLPIVDDFSKDKFTPVSEPGDANVTTETHYRIEFSSVPDVSGNQYVNDTTYTINISKNSDGDLIKDSIPNPVFKATIFDLSINPPTSLDVDLWIDTTYVDSVFNSISPDIKFAFSPDYVQDSLKVHTVDLLANSVNYLWQDRAAWRNFTRGINPPTIGVATFDGIDDAGLSYDLTSTTSYGLADELTSKALKMGAFAPIDSVYLSFFYQFQGNGDAPDAEDSLVLQFWSPLESKWNSIWKAASGSISEFDQVMIPITNANYFVDGFQFRFQNYGTLSGAVDHWHLDYVYLSNSRTYDDTNQPDLAFRYNVTSLLKDYAAMPWEHYVSNPSGVMGDKMTVSFFNTNSITESFEDHTLEVLYGGVPQTTILGPAIVPDFLSQTELFHDYDPKGTGYFFDPNVNTLNADFEVKSYFTHAGDFNSDNDTASYTQSFYNYYSYDDNSPEGGYYVLANNVSIAQRFTSILEDTLRAIQIHFVPVAFNAQTETFYLTVWENDNGSPGEILYQNIGLNKPSYIGFENAGFVEYALDSYVVLPAGEFFVGLQQTTKSRINIGFDINNDNSDRVYYNVGGSWFNTSLSGTLMMRAVFKTEIDNIILPNDTTGVYIPENETEEEEIVDKANEIVYPNPFSDYLLMNDDRIYKMSLYNQVGQLITFESYVASKIDLSYLSSGIYIMKLIDENSEICIVKIIKQ